MKSFSFNPILIASALLLVATLTSCNKKFKSNCPDYEDRHYEISEEELALIPYTGYDTLTYKRTQLDSGLVDTITFVGQGINEYIEHDIYGYGEHNCDGKILKHSIYTDYMCPDSALGYKWKIVPESRIGISSYIEIDDRTLSLHVDRLKNTTAPFFHHEIELDGLSFDSVIMTGNQEHIYSHLTYYNKRYGIVRMEVKDSSIIYQLIP